ncbi:hypothetical protein ACHAWF_005740 [Thalassiosira exigua]
MVGPVVAPRHAALAIAIGSCFWSSSTVAAFAGIQTHRRATATRALGEGYRSHRRSRTTVSLSAKDGDDDDEEDADPLMNDRREGMADAFAALDSLSADDFDDLRPISSTANESPGTGTTDNMEGSAKLFMEMQAELSSRGEEGVYDDILGDLTGEGPEIGTPVSYLKTDEEDATGLVQALDDAADLLAAEPPPESGAPVLEDADGLGASGGAEPAAALTTAAVSNDILTQEIEPSLSMEEFMSSAMQEAVEEIEVASEASSSPPGTGRTEDIAKTAEQLLEDQELRKEIESIFDKAGEKLRLEVEAMKREQEAVTQGASKRGMEYLESEKQRISEAEESVTRLIQKVAKETEEVQKAMVDLELAKDEASGKGGGGSLEDTAIDLKRGGLIKQASLVGGLLLGSRAVTETIMVLGSPYGEEHFVPAVVQAVIALACAAYFFLVK